MSQGIKGKFKPKKNPARTAAWVEGYGCAVASVVRMHGASALAHDLIKQLDRANLEFIHTDDLAILTEHGLVDSPKGPK